MKTLLNWSVVIQPKYQRTLLLMLPITAVFISLIRFGVVQLPFAMETWLSYKLRIVAMIL